MKRFTTVLLILAAFAIAIIIARSGTDTSRPAAPPTNTKKPVVVALAASSTSTTAPTKTATAIPSPTKTLKPPPTFEPPSITPLPTNVPTDTPVPTIDLSVQIPGLISADTPVPAASSCVPRKDWKLTYTVQFNDALERIADKYGTNVDDLVAGNCLTNKNVIYQGQVLKVPGSAQPVQPEVACVPYELLTPFNGTLNVPGGGNLSVTWRGPRSPYTLIRIFRPDGTTYEDVVEIRQNELIDAQNNLAAAGTYKWYLFPLNHIFQQACPEGGPYYFTKAQAPTPTPTSKVPGG